MKQKPEMKKELLSILFGGFLLAGAFLASCSENGENGGEPSMNGERMLTFTVSSKFEDVEESARNMETPDTVVRELPNGLVLKAVLEEDRTAESRGAEIVADGTGVLAIVVDEGQNTVHGKHFLKVQNSKLTVPVPDDRNVHIVFYSYNSATTPATALKAGDDVSANPVINTVENTPEAGLDAMMATTATITPGKDGLGGVVFAHLFTQVRATVTTTHDESLDGDVAVNGLVFNMPGSTGAAVKLDGSFTSMNDKMMTGTAKDSLNVLPSLSTEYCVYMPSTSQPTTFRLAQVTLTVPIDIPEENGTFTLSLPQGSLKSGYRYNIAISIACRDNSQMTTQPATVLVQNNINATGVMTTRDLYRLVNTPQGIFGGTTPTYYTTTGQAIRQNNYYWFIKPEYRSEIATAPVNGSVITMAGWITNGVKASGKYIQFPCGPQYSTEGVWYGHGQFTRTGCTERSDGTYDAKMPIIAELVGPGKYYLWTWGWIDTEGRIYFKIWTGFGGNWPAAMYPMVTY